MLTQKQSELLEFIDRHLAERGISPTFDEMKVALGLRSKSGIARLLSGLEERGYIRRIAARWRAIELVKPPAGLRALGSIDASLVAAPWLQVIEKPELRRAIGDYAREHNLRPTVAINELVRQSLGLVD